MGTREVNDTRVYHRILVSGRGVTAARALIEVRLGVQTTCKPWGYGKWVIDFHTKDEVNLDFLRPDILPPLEAAWRDPHTTTIGRSIETTEVGPARDPSRRSDC